MSTTFNLFATKYTSYDNRKTFKKETELVSDEKFTANYIPMAKECGLKELIFGLLRKYDHSDGFERKSVYCADQAVPILKKGIELLRANPQHFKELEPSNGWGTYCDFLQSCMKTLRACKKFPEAKIFYS
tara:strand:+ start:109 stop:498 length:390 start_codon:yes stop_codon:yes gene_type:complete